MALLRFAVCALALAPAVLDASSAFMQQASRSHAHARAFAGLRFSPQDPAARSLLALDTDHDGRIDPDEVAAFARSQGLDAEAATEEFSSIDVNGDGVLDSAELQQLLGSTPPSKFAAGRQAEGATEAPPAATVIVDSAAETQDAASGAVLAEAAPQMALVAPKSQLISEESRASVRMAAAKVAEDLALEEQEENNARELDRKAAEVRASFTALAKSTAQNALRAGAKAAHIKADELTSKISKLMDEAEKAEVRAAALTAKSKLEVEQGKELMAAADQALRLAPRSRM